MKTKQAVENKNYLPNGGFRFSQKYVNTSVAIPTNYTSFVGMDFGRCARGGTRITSYNVCYTKLLRP